jgi:hypothetical protein
VISEQLVVKVAVEVEVEVNLRPTVSRPLSWCRVPIWSP